MLNYDYLSFELYPMTDEIRDATDGPTDERVSRRTFTRALGAGAGALALGSAATGTAAAEEACGSFATLSVGGGDFQLINNDWGSADVDMCIRTAEDGRYGYDWATRSAGGPPNYPEVLLGTKPWGSDTGVADFPVQRRDVDELTLTVDVDQSLSGGEWDLAEEWWLLEQPPDEETGTHVYEVMLVLDWGGGHDHYMEEEAVWTDEYGNTIDYWANYDGGGTNADFHIFRVRGGLTSGTVDLGRIVEFMSRRHGVAGDLWLSGIELGNEYWEGASGDVTYEQFDVTVNGTTYTSGPDGGSGGGGGSGDGGGNDGDGDSGGGSGDDSGSRTVSEGVYRIENVDSGKVLDVTDASRIGGANVQQWEYGGGANQHWRADHLGDGRYRLVAQHSGKVADVAGWSTDDGGDVHQWEWLEQDNQRWYVDDLGDGEYRVRSVHSEKVLEVENGSDADGANVQQWSWNGGTHQTWRFVPVDDGGEGGDDTDGGDGSDALVVNDYDGDPAWPGENDLGNWCGAGSFENGDGEVVDGALRLSYDGEGWFGERIERDISDYSRLVVRVRGETGDEADDFTVELGGSRRLFADVADRGVGTEFADVAVDLGALDADLAAPGQLTLNFWQGASSTVEIDEIRLA